MNTNQLTNKSVQFPHINPLAAAGQAEREETRKTELPVLQQTAAATGIPVPSASAEPEAHPQVSLKALETELSAQKEKLKEALLELKQERKAREGIEARARELEQEKALVAERLAEVQKEREDSNRALSAARQEQAELRSRHQQLSDQNAQLEKKVATLTIGARQIEEERTGLQKQLREGNAREVKLNAALEASQAQLNDALEKCAQESTALMRTDQTLQKVQRENRSLLALKSEKESDIRDLKNKLKDTQDLLKLSATVNVVSIAAHALRK